MMILTMWSLRGEWAAQMWMSVKEITHKYRLSWPEKAKLMKVRAILSSLNTSSVPLQLRGGVEEVTLPPMKLDCPRLDEVATCIMLITRNNLRSFQHNSNLTEGVGKEEHLKI